MLFKQLYRIPSISSICRKEKKYLNLNEEIINICNAQTENDIKEIYKTTLTYYMMEIVDKREKN